MSNQPQQIVQKLWNYCNILRDDGLSYGDYVEQLTFLLFLKMADEQTRPPFNKPSPIPKGQDWPSLLARDGDELEIHYRHMLGDARQAVGHAGRHLPQGAEQDPGPGQAAPADRGPDRQGAVVEPVRRREGRRLRGVAAKERRGREGRRGPVLHAAPAHRGDGGRDAAAPGQTICDPACGTGGFLLAAHDYLAKHYQLDRAQKKQLKSGTLFGIELVDSVARLCAMNLLLARHRRRWGRRARSYVDGRAGREAGEYDMVLTNPPFGKKSSVTIVNEEGEAAKESLIINRDDFWATTSNKQLNFLQHIFTILKQHGRAAVVVPDNVLFEGGAGETDPARAAQAGATCTRCCACRPASSTRRA